MTQANHQLARDFFAALSNANIPDSLLTADMTAWTTSSGTADRARYQGGIKLFAQVFNGGFRYTVDSLTAEDDRVAAEVTARGTLTTGEPYQNTYVFVLRIRDGRIAAVAEHFNPVPVRDKIMPLLQAVMAKMAAPAPRNG
jgi:ketosteroid isomerase-like protein